MRGRTTCHMHGAKSRGPKSAKGKEMSRKAALRHGGYTKQVLDELREIRILIKESKNVMRLS